MQPQLLPTQLSVSWGSADCWQGGPGRCLSSSQPCSCAMRQLLPAAPLCSALPAAARPALLCRAHPATVRVKPAGNCSTWKVREVSMCAIKLSCCSGTVKSYCIFLTFTHFLLFCSLCLINDFHVYLEYNECI